MENPHPIEHTNSKKKNNPILDGEVDLDTQSGTKNTKWTKAIALAFIERTNKTYSKQEQIKIGALSCDESRKKKSPSKSY